MLAVVIKRVFFLLFLLLVFLFCDSNPSLAVEIVKPNYRVKINEDWGAAVTEFYNNRTDGSANLILDEVGAAFQAAVFGNQAIAQGNNCFGSGFADLRYNPTQAGTICGGIVGSEVVSCTTESGADCLSVSSFSGKQLKYLVHFKSFGSCPVNLIF
ncbi:MAG: hypothetical protein ABID04_02170 [Patescibacteria group bacterium]